MRSSGSTAVAAVVLAAVLIGGCGSPEEAREQPQIAYLCRETNELVLAPTQPVPAVNPETGRATLLRALYCEQCGRWHAVPLDFPANPQSYRCPRHRTLMSATGPDQEE